MGGKGHNELLQGDVGQRELLRLAQEARLLAMKPDPDRAGWDFCVEENERASEIALDLRPASRRWMIQVKTVRPLGSSVAISLSNWQRMAKQPLPWFVLVVEVDELQPKRAFLVHIGEFWIRRVLERLTRLVGASEERLNKRTMALKWCPEDELSPSTGATFLGALQRDAGEDPAAYATRKQSMVDNVGYDGPRYRGTMKLHIEGVDDLAEFAVGIRDSLPITTATVDRVRFGVPLREFEATGGALTLEKPPVSTRARITLIRDGNATHRCSLEFDVVTATSIFPMIPSAHERAVFRHPIVQIHIHASDSKLDFHYELPDHEAEVALSELGPASEFIATIGEATRDVTLEVQFQNGLTMSSIVEYPATQAGDFARAAIPIANAWRVARRLGLEHVRVRPIEIVAEHGRFAIGRVALESGTGSARVADVKCESLPGGLTAMVGYTGMLLGETVCAMGVSLLGHARLESEKNRVAIDNGQFRAHGVRVVPRAQFDETRVALQDQIEKVTLAEVDALGAASVFVPRPSEPDARGS